MDKSAVVQTARQCIGTPFVLQGRVPGVGLDCAGLLAAVAKKHKFQLDDQIGYNVRLWVGEKLLEGCRQNFERIDKLENACILLMWFRRPHLPQHFAIYTEDGTIIQTEQKTGRMVEVVYDETWIRRTHSMWKFKEV